MRKVLIVAFVLQMLVLTLAVQSACVKQDLSERQKVFITTYQTISSIEAAKVEIVTSAAYAYKAGELSEKGLERVRKIGRIVDESLLTARRVSNLYFEYQATRTELDEGLRGLKESIRELELTRNGE